jgi:hypothetical protein
MLHSCPALLATIKQDWRGSSGTIALAFLGLFITDKEKSYVTLTAGVNIIKLFCDINTRAFSRIFFEANASAYFRQSVHPQKCFYKIGNRKRCWTTVLLIWALIIRYLCIRNMHEYITCIHT